MIERHNAASRDGTTPFEGEEKMARSRKYGWNGELPARQLSGQALIVFNGIKGADQGTMLTGKDWTERIGKGLATRQDPYRVVLYYILILKGLGVIKTEEFDITAVTKDAASAAMHPVTVRSTGSVEAGQPINVDAVVADVLDTEDVNDEELDTVDELAETEK